MAIEFKSTFVHNSYIPKKHACEGEDVSPELMWSDLPQGTSSLALIMDDPDAPSRAKPLGVWVHWVIYDIPPDLNGLEENLSKTETLPNGAKQGLVWGFKDSECDRVGYGGPCPPPGSGPHRYFFKLYALKKKLGLGPKATKTQLLKAMEGKILGQAELIGLYER